MIYVELFDTFKMYECTLEKEVVVPLSKKAGCILAYLLLNKDKNVSKDELSEMFWESNLNNPHNALITFIYRLRSTLKEYLGDRDYILEVQGCYCWNREIEVTIDAEIFERKIQEIPKTEATNAEKIRMYESILPMYTGEFMKNCGEFYWVNLTAGYYKSLVRKSVLQLIFLYKAELRYSDIEELCRNYIKEGYLDEELFYYQILAKIALREFEEAKQLCDQAIQILKKEYGVSHAEKIEMLKVKIGSIKGIYNRSINEIYEEIENQEINGAFSCSILIFMEICRLEHKQMVREAYNGIENVITRHILLVSFRQKNHENVDETLMKNCENVIKKNMRSGDVISRCGDDQFIFLLKNCLINDCVNVANRIEGELKHLGHDLECSIEYKCLSDGDLLKTVNYNKNHKNN